ncbi:DUF3368 domain-containing protein [Chloroflexus sp.]
MRVLLEAKAHGLMARVEPYVSRLADSGMWFSPDMRVRILQLAGEYV